MGEEDEAHGLAIAILCMGAREPDCRGCEQGKGVRGYKEKELTRTANAENALHNVEGAGALCDGREADEGVL